MSDPKNTFNEAAFLKAFTGMEDLAIEATLSFLQNLPQLLDSVSTAVKTGNMGQLEISAHTLKGVLSNFSAPLSTELAFELELLGKNKGSAQQIQKSFASLNSELDMLVPALKQFLSQRGRH